MEFQDVVRHRRMVRKYDLDRPVPKEIVERILHNAVRAPSAGFSQGWGFLVLDTQEDIARFREACLLADEPNNYLASRIEAPLLIVAHSNKSGYIERYARPDKGRDPAKADEFWPAPYWDVDTGMAALLILQTAVDAGLGACFFGVPVKRFSHYRTAFGVPEEFKPIGAISIGYSTEPPRDLRDRRKPADEVVHRGRWGVAAARS
jgi:nitroreductase